MVKNFLKSNQTWFRVSHVYLECTTERIFCYSLPRKKVRISIGNLDFFAYSIFKNIEISSVQGIVQIEPNSA